MENKKSKFTDEQLSAVEAVSGDILISAAAGSGKTTVLVERLIRMIMDTSSPVNIGNILALTFTKAAASNMRMKIMKAIEGRLETAKGEEKVYLSGQYNMINQAAIMTIDAFCLDVVRKNFRAVNIDPNFKIGDNTELAIMRKEVLDEVFEEFYSENDEGFIEFINAFSKGAYDNEAFKLIINIYEEIQSQLYPLEWLEKCVQKSLFSDIDEFMDSPIIEYVKNDCLEKLNTALNYLLYIKRFYEENKLEISDIILNEIVQVNELISAIKSDIAFF
ncbi:MAG: UvrD-helicase domain-containing protein, partial [Firmicutes bacterium]|nr:UvrD-helicase domain-containing protein [Bacillota bacterium]